MSLRVAHVAGGGRKRPERIGNWWRRWRGRRVAATVNFRNTRIYEKAIALVQLSCVVVAELPVGCGFLADQLRRASSSVVLNFAEGHDKGSLREQRRYLRIARGSAMEVAAALDVGLHLGAVGSAHHARGIELCDHLVRMLFRFRQQGR
ncbi:MAG: four helix bundle protein [Deltaproteobacteria bacterium]|nr:four helix bundle protein [Deltaproteobacteria bacterium]